MLNRLRAFSDSIRSSLWFWPILMTTLGILLAQATILLDQSAWIKRQHLLSTASDALGVEWLFGLGAEGARALLATIAGSMISIAATVFSITIVALSLAAGQLGPRLLRTFMRDRGTQLSLGNGLAKRSCSSGKRCRPSRRKLNTTAVQWKRTVRIQGWRRCGSPLSTASWPSRSSPK